MDLYTDFDELLLLNYSFFNLNMSNATYSYDEFEPAVEEGLDISFRVVLALLIALVNMVVMAVILSDQRLRTSPKYIHIFNLTIADLLYSLTVLPLLAEFSIRKTWVHYCELRIFVDLYDICFHPAFSWLALCMLNIIILFLVTTSLFDKRASRPYIALALIVVPWAMTSIALIPSYRSLIEPYEVLGQPCIYMMSPDAHIGLMILTYPIMCLFLIVTSFLTIVLVLYRRNVSICGGKLPSRGDDRVPRGDPGDERREFMLDVILASTLSVLLSLPVFAVQMYFQIKNGEFNCVSREECKIYQLCTRIVHFVRVSRCALLPLIWFLGVDFRHAFVKLMKCGKKKRKQKMKIELR